MPRCASCAGTCPASISSVMRRSSASLLLVPGSLHQPAARNRSNSWANAARSKVTFLLRQPVRHLTEQDRVDVGPLRVPRHALGRPRGRQQRVQALANRLGRRSGRLRRNIVEQIGLSSRAIHQAAYTTDAGVLHPPERNHVSEVCPTANGNSADWCRPRTAGGVARVALTRMQRRSAVE